MNIDVEPLHFESTAQLQTALFASISYGTNRAARSLLEFAYQCNERGVYTDKSHHIDLFTTDSNFASIRRDVIEAVIVAADDSSEFPYLSVAAAGLLDYFKSSTTTPH